MIKPVYRRRHRVPEGVGYVERGARLGTRTRVSWSKAPVSSPPHTLAEKDSGAFPGRREARTPLLHIVGKSEIGVDGWLRRVNTVPPLEQL